MIYQSVLVLVFYLQYLFESFLGQPSTLFGLGLSLLNGGGTGQRSNQLFTPGFNIFNSFGNSAALRNYINQVIAAQQEG